jgi:hypothetical protein
VGGVYAFHAGYWGPHVGFYGGVNYGFGYGGVGFAGGRWVGNSFAYNRSVTNVTNVTVIHNTYNETVVNNVTVNNRVSFNGGAGGIAAQPTAQERAAAAEPHVPPTTAQRQHVQEAQRNPALAAKVNGGHPSIAATPRPAAFNAPGVVGARGAPPVAQTRALGAPGAGAPGTAGTHPGQAYTAQPGAARPNGVAPNTVRPNVAQPNAVRPNGVAPNTANGGHPPVPAAKAPPKNNPPAKPKADDKKREER